MSVISVTASAAVDAGLHVRRVLIVAPCGRDSSSAADRAERQRERDLHEHRQETRARVS